MNYFFVNTDTNSIKENCGERNKLTFRASNQELIQIHLKKNVNNNNNMNGNVGG